MTRLFGFAQLDFAGRLSLADGRYVVRDGDRERVLVIETLGAPPPTRRRRRARQVSGDELPRELPLARATAVRAFETFAGEEDARAWLEEAVDSEEAVDRVLAGALADLNLALHSHAVASGSPHPQSVSAATAVAVRIGYGSGEQLADGAFTAARGVDPGGSPATRRRRRDDELRPQRRVAAVLGGRERLDACETLLLRARADLDAGRAREAALQLRVGLEALLVELRGALENPDHDADMATIDSRRHEAGELANTALQGDLDAARLERLADLLGLCERVLRRRRVLGD